MQLTDDLLSQAVMMVEDSRPTLAINLAGARQHWLEGMLRHEIGQRGKEASRRVLLGTFGKGLRLPGSLSGGGAGGVGQPAMYLGTRASRCQNHRIILDGRGPQDDQVQR